MNLDRYELFADDMINSFEFISVGRKGSIIKLIQFQKTSSPDLYNLAFGDKNFETNNLDDRVVTDNGDSEKVLVTVVAAVYIFTTKYPDAVIYAKGSTKARTRLYQMGISKYLDIAKKDFDIAGRCESKWKPYQKGILYEAFAVHRKTLILKYESNNRNK